MSQTQDLIRECREYLLAGDRETINTLAGDIDGTQTVITMTEKLDQMQAGGELSIGLETMYVWDINEQARTARVWRGFKGSTAAAHLATEPVYVNPLFSGFRIFQALNQELRDLGGPPGGLFQVKTFNATTEPVRMTYPLPAANTDIYWILQVNYLEPGATYGWVRISRYDFEVLRGFPIDPTNHEGFEAGIAVKIARHMYPGRPLAIVYGTGFGELTSLTDDVGATTGMLGSQFDLPPLGAAAKLSALRETKRTIIEATMNTRRASEVPVGSATRAAQTLMALYHDRVASELSSLQMQWPERR